jgi:hypothetical protein
MDSSGGINLAWVENSGYEIGVKIERKVGANGTFAQIDTVPTHVTSYTDLRAGPGQAYYYRVRSYNCTAHSDYSNEATVATATTQSSAGTSTGGCLIATVAFGSPQAPQVVILQAFRDRVLMKSAGGRTLIRIYYSYSPTLAGFIEKRETLKMIVRLSLFPLVAYSYWSIVLGQGVTLTLLSGLFSMLVIVLVRKRRGRGEK